MNFTIHEAEQERPGLEYILKRIRPDFELGKLYWIDATRYHHNLNGKEAGCARITHTGKKYWHIKINGKALKRSHLMLLLSNGKWPLDQIDHINGDSLDDRLVNLREATRMQNAWNHKGRSKTSGLPFGVSHTRSGKFRARIRKNHIKIQIGTFSSVDEAANAYKQKRKELFDEFA